MGKLCPSYRCVEGALLLGIVQEDGTVAFAERPLTISREFVETARAGPSPESRFRFAGPCHANQCPQWKRGKCGIPEQAEALLAGRADAREAPAYCAIRRHCRWFAQDSFSACRKCPLVTTDNG